MRYVTARENHKCVVCNKVIWEGDVCIQSHKGQCFYHEGCHKEKFEDSFGNKPTNERPLEE